MELRLLGPVELWAAGTRVDLGPAKQRAVLAALALQAGRPVPTETLIDQVWDVPPARADVTLRAHVSRIRATLTAANRSAAGIARRAGGYVLDIDPDRVDLHRFEQLVAQAGGGPDPRRVALLDQAFLLWRGSPLDGLTGDWIERVRQRLVRERVDATVSWAQAALRLGDPEPVVARLHALAADHPLAEHVAEVLMRALHAAGRRAEALACYAGIRARLVDELGVEPGESLRLVHEELLRDEYRPAEPVRAPAPARTVPAQLPAGIVGFTGRTADLKQLDALLPGADGGAQPRVGVVSGMAGVGKTSVAVQWAYQVADQFGDGQLFVNLRGFAPSGAAAVTPAEAVRGFLDALGVPAERIPVGLDAQIGLYRSLVAGKKILILLDNARDEQQVRPLLPGSPDCRVVVTSRNRLAGLVVDAGAATLALDVLPDVEARDLLIRRLGADRVQREPAAVAGIIELCARLPLALAVVAARAAERPCLDLADLAAQLGDARDRLDAFDSGDEATDVRAVFSWSYQALSPDAARLFRLLSLHPGPDISAPATASLAALPAGHTQRLLDELVRANLLTETDLGRYGFHDLLRAYAADQARRLDTDTERQAGVRRMLDHYLHSAHAATRVLRPSRASISLAPAAPGTLPETPGTPAAAMAWFTREHPVLLAALDRAATTGAHLHTWQLAWTLITFFNRRGHWNDLVTTHLAAVAAANHLADLTAEARARVNLAGAYGQLHRLDEAHAQLQQTLDLATQAGDLAWQGYAHLYLARTSELRNRADLALDHARQSLTLFDRAGDLRGEALALNAVGWYWGLLGDYQHTLHYCGRALVRHQELGDNEEEAATWDSLGYAHHHLGDHRQALTCYQRALDCYLELGDRYNEANTLNHLGETHRAAGDRRAAHDAWRRALGIFVDLGHSDADRVRARLAALSDGS